MNVPNTGILHYALTHTLHICPIACLQEKDKEKEKKKKKKKKKRKKKEKEKRKLRKPKKERERKEKEKKGKRIQYVLSVCKILKCFRSDGYKAYKTLGKGWADGKTDVQMNQGNT